MTEQTSSEAENIYQNGIVSDIDQTRRIKNKWKQWSILSDHLKYVQHDESDTLHNLNFDPLNYQLNKGIYKELKEKGNV